MSLRIFVEGNDDKNLILKILNHLKKENEIQVNDNINFNNYITILGSKSNLLKSSETKYKRISRKIGFEIKKTLFIFDCDFEEDDNICGGLNKSKECFTKLKDELNWNIDIDYYIFDKNLDYFLLTTIDNNSCFDKFKSLEECLKIENIKKNKKPIANLYRDLYPTQGFDFSHPNFNELKTKLKNLFEGMI